MTSVGVVCGIFPGGELDMVVEGRSRECSVCGLRSCTRPCVLVLQRATDKTGPKLVSL